MKVRVPVYGTVGKSVLVDPNAGAQIGENFRLPDGTVPTLAQLKALFAPVVTQQGSSGTFWRLIQEIPNAPLSVIGTPGLVSGTPGSIVAVTDKAVLHRSGSGLSFSLIDHTYIDDFTEAVQDVVGLSLVDSADIVFDYGDSDGSITARLSAAIHAILSTAETAVQPGELAPIAFTGYYSDLVDPPFIPTNLDDLSDVNAPYPTDGDVLTWDSSFSAWVSLPPVTGVDHLADLLDVNVVGVTDGQLLSYDSGTSKWVPVTAGSGGTVDSVVAGTDIDVDATDPANPIVALTSGAQASLALADSAVQPGDLATVAFTGAYSDLSGTPAAVTPSALTKVDDTNVTLTLGGTPASALLQAASLTLGWTGTLAVARGGSGAGTLTGYLKGNGTSAFTASATIPYSDLTGTPTPSALTKTDDTNVTLALGGTPATALIQAVSLTLGWTGQLSVARGGSGAATLTGYVKGNGTSAFTASATIPYADISGTPTPSALTKTDDTNVTVTLGGTPATALIQAVSLTLGWTGQLSVARGGSGAATLTGYLKGNGTSAFTASASIPYADISGTPTPSALTKVDDTNVTLTLGGTPATALIQATSLTLGWTGQLSVARGGSGAATLTGYLKGNGTSAFTASATIPYSDLTGTPTIPTGANPSASLGLAAVNGSATTFMRSDGAPALSQSIAPTWTGIHTFSATTGRAGSAAVISSGNPTVSFFESDAAANNKSWYLGVSGEQLQFGFANDADSVFQNFMTVDRTAQTIDSIKFLGATYCVGSNSSPPSSGASLYASAPAGGVAATFYGATTGAGGFNIDFYDTTNSAYRGFLGFGTSTVGGALVSDFGISPGTAGRVLIGNANGAAIVARFGSGAELLSLYATGTSGLGYIAFYDSSAARKGYMAYAGGAGDDTFYINNEKNSVMEIRTNNVARIIISAAGAIRFPAYGAGTLVTDASGNITASSDQRLKENIRPFTRGLADVLKINSVLHGYTVASGLDRSCSNYAGFIAQNVQTAIPEAVGTMKDGYLTVSDRAIMAAMVNALRELSNRVKVLESTQN